MTSGPIVVVGSGFTGLTAGYELARRGIPVIVLEKDTWIGGLASTFRTAGGETERFYHHFFCHDRHVVELIHELGCRNKLLLQQTATAVYTNGSLFRLSRPIDLLRFSPLRMTDRLRLGLLVSRARSIKDSAALDEISAMDWLRRLCGPDVSRVVWEPLLRGKFGPYAEQVSARWMRSKLLSRGGSRNKVGGEALAYYDGGFGALAQTLVDRIRAAGGKVMTDTPAMGIITEGNAVKAVKTPSGIIETSTIVATCALPIIADLLRPHVSPEYTERLRDVKYLGNVCLVLELRCRLSKFYWINVAESDFPFVGVIEHTNFQPAGNYGGRHIVYLSQYLDAFSDVFRMSSEQLFERSLPYLVRMFPGFERSDVLACHLCKAAYAQPVPCLSYSRLIPQNCTPLDGFYIATMAQIYPEDRGVNFAIRDGRRIAGMVAGRVSSSRQAAGLYGDQI